MTRQVMVDGYTSSIILSDVATDSDFADRLKWWGGQPDIAFIQSHRDLFQRASRPFSLILGADVLENNFQEWYIWMN